MNKFYEIELLEPRKSKSNDPLKRLMTQEKAEQIKKMILNFKPNFCNQGQLAKMKIRLAKYEALLVSERARTREYRQDLIYGAVIKDQNKQAYQRKKDLAIAFLIS